MIRQILIKAVIHLICFAGLVSCSTGLAGLYGIKKVKAVDENKILRCAKRYKIPPRDCYEMDTSYFSYLYSLDTVLHKEPIKNHYQPLQALYFNQSRRLCSFQINCYTGGFPNLKWDRNEIMTTFPPKEQAPLDSIISFDRQLSFFQPLSKTDFFTPEVFDYIVIVHWSRFMGRQSKRLVRTVQNNLKLETDKRIKVIYVNTDNAFAR